MHQRPRTGRLAHPGNEDRLDRRCWQDYLHWQQRDEKILAAINELIKDIKRNPFKGLGKPEP
jgi:Txe/YoeB family toxin of toxin-antitoxin system